MTIRSLAVALVVLCVFLQFKLWFSHDGFSNTAKLKTAIAQQDQLNQHFDRVNAKIKARIQSIQDDQHAIEGIARDQLGMIKKDETYYQFVK